ncbi:Very-long-chain (3R)-3-hydroxyacyl-CoA dehydratase 3 [Holothuria leucospilota]|uniref:Very-long-chain (3R)-3-hydroxyacyl-CoA dehydratase n=1 Tax=Holothuria leucospilota TaxID=206669 RepID=A0A9Q1BM17_HOLLE|nr:Very-long-chain (3R)-3-hydroxyacyl-CoA dehydratase 3 [Holothuria leucospilota]
MEKLHPLVYWAQNKEKITLRVDLRDVSSPKIDITENKLSFKGYGEGAKGLHDYEFELELHDEINIEKSAYRISDRHIEFNLYKAYEGTWWQRLTKHKVKLSWLRIDFDRWRNEDDSPSEEEEDAEPGMPPSPEQLEQIDKMQKDLLEVKDKAYADIKNCYLFFYNAIQFILFSCTFVYLLQRYAVHGKENMKEAFDRAILFVGMSQMLAVLELVHAATGLVKSGVTTILMQLLGRNLLLFLVILPAEPIHSQPMVCYLFLVWSAVEVIRYPFYAFACMSIEFEVLTWLRYTVWIPLYPLGFISEAIVVLLALPFYKETDLHSLYLPNSLNISLYFPYYLYSHLAFIPFGGYGLMKHMWRMRKKKLAALSASLKKEKMS